ncbi:MAG: ABC transporter ATP-binding protein [Candidatus Aminicenantes bacterium]
MEHTNHTLINVENVSKKFCKSLKYSMIYGLFDIARNMIGRSSRSEKLRKNEFWAVNHVSFELKRGENLGVIGPNGSGKTTLLKMLNGIFWPDKGKITVSGRVGALIEVGAGFHPMLTGRENIYVNGAILGMSKQEIHRRFEEIVDFADIGDFLDTPVKNYSSGMFVRLGFAIAVNCNPDILLVDEVLAVGDKGFQAKCFNKIGELKQKGTTTILVSHNMHAISIFSNNVLFLHQGKAAYFTDVFQGIKEYSQLFTREQESEIEKILSGNDKITFFDVQINQKVFSPGDSFEILFHYKSSVTYGDVDIDMGIYTDKEPGLYFQATNQAYKRKIDLLKGTHQLKVKLKNIRINDSLAKVAISIWSAGRTEKLFWWRIPISFNGIRHCTGRNFLNAEFTFE